MYFNEYRTLEYWYLHGILYTIHMTIHEINSWLHSITCIIICIYPFVSHIIYNHSHLSWSERIISILTKGHSRNAGRSHSKHRWLFEFNTRNSSVVRLFWYRIKTFSFRINNVRTSKVEQEFHSHRILIASKIIFVCFWWKIVGNVWSGAQFT